MSRYLSRRAGVRILSFSLAVTAALTGVALCQYRKASRLHRTLEVHYQRSMSDLTDALSNITTVLQKEVYAGSDWQRTNLSAQLWREAAAAKSAMSALPVGDFHLSATYKFLSQVGEYAMALSRRTAAGEPVTEEETANLRKLWDYSQGVETTMSNLAKDLYNSKTPVGDLAHFAAQFDRAEEAQGEVPSVVTGFQEMEEAFEGYPTLIYDGPFSDHIMERTPRMLEGLAIVDRDTAQSRAASVLGLGADKLEPAGEESSKMPSYVFTGPDTTVSVTKAGGLLSCFLRSREVSSIRMENEDAVQKAKDFLTRMGMTSMQESYFETANGICTVNFAYQQGDVTVYTDLIKVSVAMDTGEVLGMDARGYLTNHTERSLPAGGVTEAEARGKLSPSLTVQSVKKAVIPTSGLNEAYCYEFLTTGPEQEKILVYISIPHGREEQLLILTENESGTLTR